ncbi:DUF3038 domain-containing protein [Dolichospermum circinale CS-1225]|uniref:DUF3038 domain-containing protein n=1 Tax=Dolichospermum circinale CS-537/01 TaxID=3021739 RepID=A0ABT5A9L1_9CYAN|nr:DUF3038 domain-containing protein [Dolichospermum circinale]MDB9457045.1 DUF3038 domain-containing protein [Dolichospermum circinale CS-545/17]MDB9468676.1 DUF3038 domain-containing protein [Dolichospermum circinale CS-539/09]MDB9469493.1 DUF3038 domain-containing protein [Dolichospermum circinale CS-539]MDB9488164.1 DUF3038 domain-containing protein [Dolichospermum circinale CS-537/01]MDB9522244.1 DUF3038 domain-containing protein [Dolichospermum circinale CS-1225]
MNVAAHLQPVNINNPQNSQGIHEILDTLPDPAFHGQVCPRKTRTEIDLMLLAIEALELGGSEAILSLAEELDLKGIIKNRVNLWRMRASNPMRRAHSRRPLDILEAKALVVIACYIARRLTVTIRQLLTIYQQLAQKQIPLEQNLRLANYLERFRAHFKSRMNYRRSGVIALNSDDKLDQLAINLLGKLLFCTGTAGMQRYWISLFDGEVE